MNYIELLNHLRFSRGENNEALLLLRDQYEEELEDGENYENLIHPYVKLIRTDDIELLSIMKDKYFQDIPEYHRDDLQDITDIVSLKYDKIMNGRKRGVSGVKKKQYNVYLRVHTNTGHFYIGHSQNDAHTRNLSEFYFLRGDITKWTKSGYVSLIQEFVRHLIIEGKSHNDFRLSNLISFDDKDTAEAYESILILLVSLDKIPSMKPDKMLNIQYRYNERMFTYEDYKGNEMCYVNDFPNFYRFVL